MTRNEAYITLFRPSVEEMAEVSKKKICTELAKATYTSISTWNNQAGKPITKDLKVKVKLAKERIDIELELSKAKQLLGKVANSRQKFDDTPHACVNIWVIDEIKEFLMLLSPHSPQ